MTNLKFASDVAFYFRVSGSNQSFESQELAAQRYMNEEIEKDMLFKDFSVSANKVKMDDRPELMRLIKLIRQGRVRKLYVYDRSRLARDYFEYLELYHIFLHYNIEVIFTTSDPSYSAFSNNFILEAISAFMVDMEGKSIASRKKVAHAKAPHAKFGYKKEENEKMQYRPKEEIASTIRSFFKDACKVSSGEELINFLLSYQKILIKRNPMDLVKLVSDPFYSGMEFDGRTYIKLKHVSPLIEYELFLEANKAVGPYINSWKNTIKIQEERPIVALYCEQCGEKLKFKMDYQNTQGTYYCSNKHKKLHITVNNLHGVIRKSLEHFLSNLSVDELRATVNRKLVSIQNSLHSEEQKIVKSLEYLEDIIGLMSTKDLKNKKYKNHIIEHNRLKQKLIEVEDNMHLCKSNVFNVEELVEALKHCIENNYDEEYLWTIATIVIQKVIVANEKIDIVFYFNKFAKLEDFLVLEVDY